MTLMLVTSARNSQTSPFIADTMNLFKYSMSGYNVCLMSYRQQNFTVIKYTNLNKVMAALIFSDQLRWRKKIDTNVLTLTKM